MKLKIYNKENATSYFSSKAGQPRVSFYPKNGNIVLNRALSEKLTLSSGGIAVEFAQDENEPTDWFLRVNPDGLVLKEKLSKGQSTGYFNCSSTKIVKDLLSSIDKDTTISCVVGSTPAEDGWYPIFTSSAK